MTAHRKGLGNEAEECVIEGSPKPFSKQVVDEIVASEMEDAGARRLRQGTRKMDLEGFYYRRVLSTEELVECLVPRELELTAGELLRRKSGERQGDAA